MFFDVHTAMLNKLILKTISLIFKFFKFHCEILDHLLHLFLLNLSVYNLKLSFLMHLHHIFPLFIYIFISFIDLSLQISYNFSNLSESFRPCLEHIIVDIRCILLWCLIREVFISILDFCCLFKFRIIFFQHFYFFKKSIILAFFNF